MHRVHEKIVPNFYPSQLMLRLYKCMVPFEMSAISSTEAQVTYILDHYWKNNTRSSDIRLANLAAIEIQQHWLRIVDISIYSRYIA